MKNASKTLAAPVGVSSSKSAPKHATGTLEIADPKHVALKDLNIPQLAEAFMDLDHAEQKYTRLSGVCATLKGLVLIEVKGKLKHGEYEPWLKKEFPKGCRTARRYVNYAKAFLSKSDINVRFAALTKDLHATLLSIQQHELDLSNPAVAEVAKWVNDRSAYQLQLELGDSKPAKGGDTTPRCQHCKKKVALHEVECPHCKQPSGQEALVEDSPEQAAIDLWTPIFSDLLRELDEESQGDLPERGECSRETFRQIHAVMGDKIKGWKQPKESK